MGFVKFIDKRIRDSKIGSIYSTLSPYHLKIVRFKDLTHKKPKFRHWLTFKINDDTCCILTTFTTSHKLPMRYFNDDNAINSVIHISGDEFNPPFCEFTFLDCNIKDIEHRKTFKGLRKCIDWTIGIEDINLPIPLSIEERIVKAIVNSRFTVPEIKNGFKNTYPQYFSEEKIEEALK